MKRVLIISHVLPPSFMGGTPRLLRWCETLPKLGWQPILAGFTDDPIYAEQDPLPAGIESIGVSLRPSGGVFGKAMRRLIPSAAPFPDRFAPELDKLATAIEHAAPKVDLVMISAPSFSLLKRDFLVRIKAACGVPLILEMRDALSANSEYSDNATARAAAKDLEHEAQDAFAGAISVSPRHTAELANWFPSITHRAMIPNSFLRSAYTPHRNAIAWPGKREGVLRLTFVGHAYGSRAPALLLEAIRPLLRARPDLARVLRVRLIGRGDAAAIGDWSEFPGIFEAQAAIPYREIPVTLCQSDVLLTVIGADPLIDGVPGAKVYEYLGARRPIFCLSTGAAARIVMRTETGVIANPDRPAQVQDALMHLYQNWLDDKAFVMADESRIDQYEALKVAGDLVSFFDQMLQGSSASPQG